MAAFSLEEGMEADVLLTICALRTRVSISAMGSLMLMCVSPTSWPWSCRALRRAWPFHAVCGGVAQTCWTRRGGGPAPRSDLACGGGWDCAGAVAGAGGPGTGLGR